MSRFSSIFGQILHLFSRREFFEAVHATRAERGAKGFGCWDQFVAMLFCQLGQAHSLREICGGLASCFGKAKHLGLKEAPKRSTLSYANEHRSWQLYERIFYQLLSKCRQLDFGKRRFRFKNKLFSLDATVIELCAGLFDWAKFRQTKGAVKLHLLLDHDGYLPVFAHITTGKVHEIKVAQTMFFPAGSIVAIDKGYIDYDLFWRWTESGVFFVTRQKDNARYRVLEEKPLPVNRNVLTDQLIELEGFYSQRKYPGPLRRLEVWDEKNEKVIVLLTNHMTFGATTIAAIYKDRWQIGASSQGRIIQSVKVRPRLKDLMPRSLEGAVARKQDGEALRQHSLKGGCATLQVVTYSERRRSLVTRTPVAETVDNVRRQQEMTVMSHIRHFSPAGYQRRHGAKDHAETGEALDARRRNLDEEFRPITLNGKWQEWCQGDGSGWSTFDLRAAKRAGREGPGPVDIPFGKVRQG